MTSDKTSSYVRLFSISYFSASLPHSFLSAYYAHASLFHSILPPLSFSFFLHQALFSGLSGIQLKGNEAANVQKDRNLLALSSCCKPLKESIQRPAAPQYGPNE